MPGTSGPKSRPSALHCRPGPGDIRRTLETKARPGSSSPACRRASPSPIPQSPLGARPRGREGRGQIRGHTAPSTMTRTEPRSRSFITIPASQFRLAHSTNPSPRQLMSRRLLSRRLLSRRLPSPRLLFRKLLSRRFRANSYCRITCHTHVGFGVWVGVLGIWGMSGTIVRGQ